MNHIEKHPSRQCASYICYNRLQAGVFFCILPDKCLCSRGPLNNLLMLSLYYVSWTTFQKFVTSEKHEPDGSTEYMGASVNSSGIYLINCLNYIQCLNWGGAAGSQTPIRAQGPHSEEEIAATPAVSLKKTIIQCYSFLFVQIY